MWVNFKFVRRGSDAHDSLAAREKRTVAVAMAQVAAVNVVCRLLHMSALQLEGGPNARHLALVARGRSAVTTRNATKTIATARALKPKCRRATALLAVSSSVTSAAARPALKRTRVAAAVGTWHVVLEDSFNLFCFRRVDSEQQIKTSENAECSD